MKHILYVVSTCFLFFSLSSHAGPSEKVSCASALSDESGVGEEHQADPQQRHGVYNSLQVGSAFVMPWLPYGTESDRHLLTYVFVGEQIYRCELPMPEVNNQNDFKLTLSEGKMDIPFTVRTIEVDVKGAQKKRLDFIAGTPRQALKNTQSIPCVTESSSEKEVYLDKYIVAVLMEAKAACLNKKSMMTSKICWDAKNEYFKKAQNACMGISKPLDQVMKSFASPKTLARRSGAIRR